MVQTPSASSEHPFIESDRVEGTAVYDARGDHIGTIERLMIEKVSGQVAYVVMSFGGLFGSGKESHTLPWGKLNYDSKLRGYRVDISESELREAPSFAQSNTFDWSNRDREQELHDYYRIPPYWRAM
jgi:sporulation protein YlmC with PRC-barrel domain